MRRLAGVMWLLLLLSPSVHAHLLKVFVYVDGDRLQGSSYFAGGAAAANARIEIIDSNSEVVAELRSDAGGEFSYPVIRHGQYRVVADTGDGHRAEWRVGAEELSIESSNRSFVETENSAQPTSSHTQAATDNQLERLLDRAVARQLGPLRQELQQHNEQARLADIVGGVGFIFGLSGVLLWWRSRR